MKRPRFPYMSIKRRMWKHEWDPALAMLDRFLTASPRHAMALVTKGHILEMQGHLAKSRRERRSLLEKSGRLYRRALRNVHHPVGEAAVLRDVGDYLSNVGRRKEALRTYDRALRILANVRRSRLALEWREEVLLSRFCMFSGKTAAWKAARREWLAAKAELERRWPERRAS